MIFRFALLRWFARNRVNAMVLPFVLSLINVADGVRIMRGGTLAVTDLPYRRLVRRPRKPGASGRFGPDQIR